MKRAQNGLRAFEGVVDFFFPPRCPVCCHTSAERTGLCESCAVTLESLESAACCEKCAMPLTEDGAPCPYCGGKGFSPVTSITRLGCFEEPLKSIIHQAKYRQRWPLLEQLADRLFQHQRFKSLVNQTDLLIPTPLHRRRQVNRGYNQADVLARCISRRSHIPVAAACRRIRQTETQTHLHSRVQRAENLRGAFVVIDPAVIRGKRVVLVDDVMTTGATLISLARTIKACQPESISALVIAVADPKGRGFEVI